MNGSTICKLVSYPIHIGMYNPMFNHLYLVFRALTARIHGSGNFGNFDELEQFD